MQEHVSQQITLKRGASTTPDVTATVGNTRAEVMDQQGVTVQARERDYLIDVADYVIGSVAVEPAEGDEIRETDGATTHVYEVRPLGAEPAWRWSDPYRQTYRIHTKYVGTA